MATLASGHPGHLNHPGQPTCTHVCEIWKCELEAVGRHCDLASRCWQTLLISPNLDSHTLSSDSSSSSWPSSYSDHYPVRIITWSMIHSHPLNATLQSHMSKTVIICNAQSFVKDSKIWTRSLWHKFFQLFPHHHHRPHLHSVKADHVRHWQSGRHDKETSSLRLRAPGHFAAFLQRRCCRGGGEEIQIGPISQIGICKKMQIQMWI